MKKKPHLLSAAASLAAIVFTAPTKTITSVLVLVRRSHLGEILRQRPRHPDPDPALPISTATISIAGSDWWLFKGVKPPRTVFSFVAVEPVEAFPGDLKGNEGLGMGLFVTGIGAGTEPFVVGFLDCQLCASDAELDVHWLQHYDKILKMLTKQAHEYQYLYCIPGTYTYIFFGTIKPALEPTSSYATALNSSIAYIDQYIGTSGDGHITGGRQFLSTTSTGVQIYAEDAGRHHLTWGVLGVALQGLNAWMAGEENGYGDATFQINDGKNEVGDGYIGAVDLEGVCVFANAYVPNTPCVPVDSKGLVYGSHGGVVC
ncbi:MAG: hypothetical protein ASARMPRED_000211 [Alectoria sarmentosa]|nr:MAG: hypothetical protein ASARMPRED_000211 [Alectoria sarmentosa]